MHRSAKISALTPIFNQAIYIDYKIILYKKSLIHLIRGTTHSQKSTTVTDV